MRLMMIKYNYIFLCNYQFYVISINLFTKLVNQNFLKICYLFFLIISKSVIDPVTLDICFKEINFVIELILSLKSLFFETQGHKKVYYSFNHHPLKNQTYQRHHLSFPFPLVKALNFLEILLV